MAVSFPRTRWHRLLARLLETLLSPVDISVETEVRVLADPPRADILLLRRRGKQWNQSQRERLADGLRDTGASHLLLEFKYREGIGHNAFVQLLSYDHYYHQHRRLARSAVASFLLSARTPKEDLLSRMGYRIGASPGVYETEHPLLAPIKVILLNELAPLPHNAPLKCFAGRRKEQRKSFEVLRKSPLLKSSLTLERMIYGLWRLMMKNAPEIDELTPEYVIQAGAEWIDAFLDAIPPEEWVKHVPPEEWVKHVPPEEFMKHITLKERLAGLDPEERLAGLDEEQIRQYLERIQKAH